jgi:class 3 adenylate cyclase
VNTTYAHPPVFVPMARTAPASAPVRPPGPPAAERLVVTVLISDVRGYSGIAERTDPVVLAGQLDEHRRAMAAAIRGLGGTIVQYAGDAVLAVFRADGPRPDHQERACLAAAAMHRRQRSLDAAWAARGLAPFGLGIGVSTGEVAAAVLGGDERLGYTLVGDTVNLAARLEAMARRPGTTVISAATAAGLTGDGQTTAADRAGQPARLRLVALPPTTVKGRTGLVSAFRFEDAELRLEDGDLRLEDGDLPAARPPLSSNSRCDTGHTASTDSRRPGGWPAPVPSSRSPRACRRAGVRVSVFRSRRSASVPVKTG